MNRPLLISLLKFTRFILLMLIAVFFIPLKVMADSCEIVVNSDDAMRFDTNRIIVPSTCEQFTVHLQHTGKRAVNIMGHNWVLSKSVDALNIYRQGRGAGLSNGYIQPDDSRVIAATTMIGGGEKSSVSFPVSILSADEKYSFFCTFPGHLGPMVGSLVLD